MMNKLDAMAFASMFKDAYKKCFGYQLETALTESESNLFSDEILKSTGLVIGWKSLKNYSHYILDDSPGKQENPSIATLDTLARYVRNAPRTDEAQRKKKEKHYPYWFQYKEEFYKSHPKDFESPKKTIPEKRLIAGFFIVAGFALIIILSLSLHLFDRAKVEKFTDDFNSVSEDSLMNKGWFIKSIAGEYWNRKDEKAGHLTLFTLNGDNWPDSGKTTNIKNLLLRKIPFDCFTAEAHLTEFIPTENWQQAGIILLEDTSFAGKSLRLSIGYNDFAGGFPSTREIIVQAITSLGSYFSKPEEIAHQRLFDIDQAQKKLIDENLENSALRIEKRGTLFRLLYSNGRMKNSAFKEVVSQEFAMQPRYIGIFALKGFVNKSGEIPAYFDVFTLMSYPCDK